MDKLDLDSRKEDIEIFKFIPTPSSLGALNLNNS